MTPTFLSFNEIIEIHRDQISRYGGTLGIRDLDLLRSALAQPAATFGGQFLLSDLFAMAAAYLFHLSQNHPFIDGNKRVAVVAAIVFLLVNDQDICASDSELERLALGVAQGQVEKTAVIHFFHDHAS